MELNTPPFNEKEFLLSLLAIVHNKFGGELRHIFIHKFNSIEPNDYPNIKSFSSGGHLSKKFISQWFAEAEKRGFVKVNQNHFFNFTEQGYAKAKSHKNPFKYFVTNHWAWALGIFLTLVNTIATVTRLLLCP